MKLSKAREGERVSVKKKTVLYSNWPTALAHKNRHKLQSTLLSLDPWSIIENEINKRATEPEFEEAKACLAQAKDFYSSATQANALEARPLSLYYSYMNLVKAFCLFKQQRTTFDRAGHGLSEQLRPPHQELINALLRAFQSPNSRGELQNFEEFKVSLGSPALTAMTDYNMLEIIPQVVAAHRLWCEAADQSERFCMINDVQYFHNKVSKECWLRISFIHEDLRRHDITVKRLLAESGLDARFKLVSVDPQTDKQFATIEEKTTTPYTGYAADKLLELSQSIRHLIWSVVTTTSPYRKHYVYLCPTAESNSKLPQLLSIYAVSFYLGSITRYRPHHYPKIVAGEFGPFIQDFITGQPQQFLYLMASWFAQRDVAKPGILV